MWLFAGVCFAISTPWVRALLERLFAELTVVFFNSVGYVSAAVATVFVLAVFLALRGPVDAGVSTSSSSASNAVSKCATRTSSAANKVRFLLILNVRARVSDPTADVGLL